MIHVATKTILLNSIAILNTLVIGISFLIFIFEVSFLSAFIEYGSEIWIYLKYDIIWNINWLAFGLDPIVSF